MYHKRRSLEDRRLSVYRTLHTPANPLALPMNEFAENIDF